MKFYIQDTRQYVGNCLLWWAKGGAGYTTDLTRAEVFSADEVARIVSNSERYKAHGKDQIDRAASKRAAKPNQ